MFERYNERARRAIFFARYEASQHGSATIESEHLLLGLIREDKSLVGRLLRDTSSIDSFIEEIEDHLTIREKVATSIDLPLANECKRVLARAAEEAEILNHRHIGTEHLLLGIFGEDSCAAAMILHARGLRYDVIQEEIANTPVGSAPEAVPQMEVFPQDAMVPDEETAKLIAAAIWLPAYGGKSASGLLVAEVVHSNVWQVTAGPLFALISATDGRVLGMGMNRTGAAGV